MLRENEPQRRARTVAAVLLFGSALVMLASAIRPVAWLPYLAIGLLVAAVIAYASGRAGDDPR